MHQFDLCLIACQMMEEFSGRVLLKIWKIFGVLFLKQTSNSEASSVLHNDKHVWLRYSALMHGCMFINRARTCAEFLSSPRSAELKMTPSTYGQSLLVEKEKGQRPSDGRFCVGNIRVLSMPLPSSDQCLAVSIYGI